MSFVRHALVGLTLVALLAGCEAEVVPPDTDNGAKACKGILDCPTGQGCVQNFCVDLPCGGRCALDELCLSNACFAIDGLSCVQDPSVCPRGFRCSQASGECQRECVTDDECTTPGFGSCNVQDGVCGQCTFNSDCKDAGTPACDTSVSRCVGCVTNDDCRVTGQAVGFQCDLVTQTCETGCNEDKDCATGQRCSGGTQGEPGRCIECSPGTEGNDCASLSPRVRCEPTALMCVECLSNSDCESGQCDTRSNTCVECVQNEYCEKGFTCDLDVFRCFPGCAGPVGVHNCPENNPRLPACDKTRGEYGTCVQCLKDADCQWGRICKKDNGGGLPVCTEGCRLNGTGEPNDARCAAPAPETRLQCDKNQGPHGKCVQCMNDNHCAATEKCDSVSKQCRCKGLGETCGATSECGWRPEVGASGSCDLGTSHKAMCMTKCGTTSVAPICTFGATALEGQQGNCPAGYVSRFASDASGNTGKKCVPVGYQCN